MSIKNKLVQGNIALENGEWIKAKTCFDSVLDENAKESRAYLGKLLSELHLHSSDELSYVALLLPIGLHSAFVIGLCGVF